MAIEYAENIFQLLANLIALLLCLFYYISSKRRGWFLAIVFFVCSLLSCYYWTSYLIIMGGWPNVSDLMAYFGWDAAYPVLFLLLMYMKTPEERRYFHPLMLLPVPLNIWQLTLYLPYGHLFNNIYQVTLCTLLACFSIQSFCWYRIRQKGQTVKPYVSLAVFLFSLFEFGMWTSTCLYEPFASLYYPFSFMYSLNYLFLIWAVRKAYIASGTSSLITFDRKYQNILKAVSLGIVLIFSLGGILLGIWMRDVMVLHLDQMDAANLYDIIPVVLFVISLIEIIFVIAVTFVVYFAQHAAENSSLREARQIAERSNAAKSEFLANMSHEIRTPINAVMGMNEIVLRESRQARDRLPGDRNAVRGIFADICGYAGIIDSAGKNLLSIINDILDISKIEAGKLEIREDPYQLSSVLRDVCSLVRFRAHSRKLAFRISVEETLPDHLYGDALRIRQVMLNILNNAVKYTKHGSVTLSVFTDTKAPPEIGQTMNLVFSVKDTGIGIRKEDLDKLYEKFERIDLAESSNVEGTGLGLAITRYLLDMMGGTIHVESIYGEGSVFTVSIPQKIESAEPVGNFLGRFDSGTETEAVPRESFCAPAARILIVDDTRMNLTVVEGLLKKTGIRIDTADSGESALQYSLSVPYDLIFMDQRMPVMDGTETMRRIRAQENGPNRQTPVICLTADAISGAKDKYLKEGFSDYLSKPIDSVLLRKILLRFLPPEKVILLPDSEEEDTLFTLSGKDFSILRAGGIDAGQGLRYCQQDEALYGSLLSAFAAGAPDSIQRLEQYYASGSWRDYAILAHSVKSTAAMIGAAGLSNAAAGMEALARTEDVSGLSSGHDRLISLYTQVSDAVRSFGIRPDPSSVPDEDAVLEFSPE